MAFNQRTKSTGKKRQKEKTQLLVFSFKKYFLMRLILSFHIQVKHNIKSTYRAYVIAFGQYLENNNNNNHHFPYYLIFHSFSSIRPADRISLYNLFFSLFFFSVHKMKNRISHILFNRTKKMYRIKLSFNPFRL